MSDVTTMLAGLAERPEVLSVELGVDPEIGVPHHERWMVCVRIRGHRSKRCGQGSTLLNATLAIVNDLDLGDDA